MLSAVGGGVIAIEPSSDMFDEEEEDEGDPVMVANDDASSFTSFDGDDDDGDKNSDDGDGEEVDDEGDDGGCSDDAVAVRPSHASGDAAAEAFPLDDAMTQRQLPRRPPLPVEHHRLASAPVDSPVSLVSPQSSMADEDTALLRARRHSLTAPPVDLLVSPQSVVAPHAATAFFSPLSVPSPAPAKLEAPSAPCVAPSADPLARTFPYPSTSATRRAADEQRLGGSIWLLRKFELAHAGSEVLPRLREQETWQVLAATGSASYDPRCWLSDSVDADAELDAMQ